MMQLHSSKLKSRCTAEVERTCGEVARVSRRGRSVPTSRRKQGAEKLQFLQGKQVQGKNVCGPAQFLTVHVRPLTRRAELGLLGLIQCWSPRKVLNFGMWVE